MASDKHVDNYTSTHIPFKQRITSRKFILAVSTMIIDTALLVGGYVDGNIYRDIMLGTVGAFILGDVWEKKS